MAENEDSAAQQEAAGERTTGRKSNRTGRVSGGDRGGGTGRRDVSQFISEFRKLSNAERAAFRAELAAGTAGRAGGQTPKFSQALDRVEEDGADEVIGALDEAIEIVNANPAEEGKALEVVRAVEPDIAAAAVTNSGYRNKPISHSLRVARQYLSAKYPDAAGGDAEDDDRDRERR